MHAKHGFGQIRPVTILATVLLVFYITAVVILLRKYELGAFVNNIALSFPDRD